MRPEQTFDELLAIDRAAEPHPRHWPLALLLLPVVAVIVPELYNHLRPHWLGLPFFVWYQFAAVAFGAVITGIVNLLTPASGGPLAAATAAAPPEDPGR